MSINAILSANAFGQGKHQALADFNYASLSSLWSGQAYPGMCFSEWGNVYMVVRNRSGGAITVGQAVSLNFSDASRTGNLATGVTAANLLTDDTHDSGMTGIEALPSYVVITAGAMATTPAMQRRHVKENTPATGASTIRVAKADPSAGSINGTDILSADIFTGTLDNTYDYTFLEPWSVVPADASALVTQGVQGICVSTSITDDYFGIIQITGLAMAIVNGTTDCPVGSLLTCSADAGELIFLTLTAGGVTGAEGLAGYLAVARILDSYTDGNPGLRHVLLRNNPLINYPIL